MTGYGSSDTPQQRAGQASGVARRRRAAERRASEKRATWGSLDHLPEHPSVCICDDCEARRHAAIGGALLELWQIHGGECEHGVGLADCGDDCLYDAIRPALRAAEARYS